MAFWLVESQEQLNDLKSHNNDEAFVELIPFNFYEHPHLTFLSLIYIRPLNDYKGYIISIDHSESLSLNQNEVEVLLKQYKKIYVKDKKEFLHHIVLHNVYDVTLNKNYIPQLTKTHNYFYNKFKDKKDINRIIPIVKHYEYCEKIFNDLKNTLNEPINQFYNNKASVVFNAIERMGLRVQTNKFIEKFHPIDNDFTYTQYNFKTTTTRPSNRFKNVNYAALNKEDNTREIFIPRNTTLIEIDIRAYHPTLLSHLMKYEFKCDDIHQEFAEMYGVEYGKAKEITFKQMYGGVFSQYKELEFFKQMQLFIDSLWNDFNENNQIVVPISNYIFHKDELTDINPSKLLNYLLQALETANNVNIMWEMFKVLAGKNTKLILYTYDAFLLDWDENEVEELEQIKNIFKKYNLHIKVKYGSNYNF